ncbi:MAG TPA: hypothetical protein PKM48_08875, partial [Parvularculaceae bacterium]|nr:hypothetical protein [Parvularculaceae bacterium]
AAAGALSAAQAAHLGAANRLFETVQQIARATTGGVFAPGAAGEAMARMMTRLLETDELQEAETKLAAIEADTRAVYEEVVRGAMSGAAVS